jgi:hypothetical protein
MNCVLGLCSLSNPLKAMHITLCKFLQNGISVICNHTIVFCIALQVETNILLITIFGCLLSVPAALNGSKMPAADLMALSADSRWCCGVWVTL